MVSSSLEGNLEEVLHHVGIEVRPRAAGDLLAGRVEEMATE